MVMPQSSFDPTLPMLAATGVGAVTSMVDGLPVANISTGALAAFAVLLIFTGRLVPYTLYRDKCRQVEKLEEQLAVKDAQLAEKDVQLGVIADVGQTVNAVMRAIQQRVPHRDGEVPQ